MHYLSQLQSFTKIIVIEFSGILRFEFSCHCKFIPCQINDLFAPVVLGSIDFHIMSYSYKWDHLHEKGPNAYIIKFLVCAIEI